MSRSHITKKLWRPQAGWDTNTQALLRSLAYVFVPHI